MKRNETSLTKYFIIVNDDKAFFDTSIKEVLTAHRAAFVQLMHEQESAEDTARMIRSLLDIHTSNGDNPVNVILSGFEYHPEFIEAIEGGNCKLVWAC